MRHISDSTYRTITADLLAMSLGGDTRLTMQAITTGQHSANDTFGNNKTTMLHEAVKANNVECVRFLLSKGADHSAQTVDEYTPLQLAFQSRRGVFEPEIVNALIDAGADINVQNNNFPPLGFAVYNKNEQMLQMALEKGADVNQPIAKDGTNSLHLCAELGFVEGAKTLISNSINLNAINYLSCTPLHTACEFLNQEMSILLIEHSDVNCKTNSNRTPLHSASHYNMTDVVTALLDNGADINAIADDGETALHYAATNGSIESVQALMKRGADYNVVSQDTGLRALDMCKDDATYRTLETEISRREKQILTDALSTAVEQAPSRKRKM
ncbi:ankyrin repeat domain-containing protein [Stenotrophomonas acidaminiphila]